MLNPDQNIYLVSVTKFVLIYILIELILAKVSFCESNESDQLVVLWVCFWGNSVYVCLYIKSLLCIEVQFWAVTVSIKTFSS